MKVIGIMFGGKSPEYNVSLESACAVIENIDRTRYKVVLIGITEKGSWYYYNGEINKIRNNQWMNDKSCQKAYLSCDAQDSSLMVIENQRIRSIQLDAIFPVLHGSNGEDGTVQGLIALSNIPLIGCGILASSLCMDKYRSHCLVEHAGIRVTKGIVFSHLDSFENILKQTIELKYPLFIKPLRAGSSFGISKIKTSDELYKAVTVAFNYDTKILIEEEVKGFEVGCAILGDEKLIIGEIDEIECNQNFFNFTEKYTLETSKIHIPARLSIEKRQEIKELCASVYHILGCQGFARVDCFISEDNEIYFNEVNTIPGFTAHSRFPSMMKAIGLDLTEVITIAIEGTLK
ncbi:MAG: D-alanine--D-serine ligase VanG [Anaerorhabdus sp.]|uniref:D-alanine--D-serine ligase VanG n=1 Tax=Anaerorhabdus sp. TaxID=1872524 RepID=UPI002FC8D7BC